MNFEKKNNIYRVAMIIIVTAIITFMIAIIGRFNSNINRCNPFSGSNIIKRLSMSKNL